MAQKPPAFQFYPRDWLTSPTVAQMSRGDRADYLHLLCHAWLSEEPGTLPLPIEVAARIVGWKASKLRSFLERFPTQFQRNPEHICNQKLRNQYLENKKYVESKSIAGRKGNDVRWHSDRSASASASASANKDKTTHTVFVPPTLEQVSNYMQVRGIEDHQGEAATFIDHHAQRKWKVSGGRGPVMIDWQAGVRTWQSYRKKFGGNANGRSKPVTAQDHIDRAIRNAEILGLVDPRKPS